MNKKSPIPYNIEEMAPPTLLINGSPRENGNTDALLARFIQGAESVSHEFVYLKLRDLRIGDCIGCCTCREESTCKLQDDMTDIRGKIENSGLLIFASPNYWCGITGLMKTFMDRLYFYHHPKNSARLTSKEAVILSTMGESTNIAYESSLLVEFFERAMKSLGITIRDILLFPGLMEKDDVFGKPDYLAQAFALGKSLGSGSSQGE
jgi:multimeric flavodoxin WrbA